MDGFCYVDPQNRGPEGKMNLEGVTKSHSLGTVTRKRLSDITNTQTHPSQDEKLRPYSFATKEYIEKLQKENVTLRQLLQESTHVLQERNKLIELTGIELTKLRINLQKLQQQNRLLAQTNSQMTMERTLDKDRMRVMQHELGCRGALLAVKDTELQLEDVKKKRRPKTCMVQKREEVTGEAIEDGGGDTADDRSKETEAQPLPAHHADPKPNRSRRSRIQSSESSGMKEQVSAKENPKDKRKSGEVKSGPQEATEMKSDCKRQCLRRQSTRFNPEKAAEDTTSKGGEGLQQQQQKDDGEEEQVETKSSRVALRRQSTRFKCEPLPPPPPPPPSSSSSSEDKFETEDERFPMENLNVTSSCGSEQVKKEQGGDTPGLGGLSRTSIGGRPLRRAAGKVQSYKEIPVNVKMRRAD